MDREIIHNPITGETLYVLESTAETFKFEFRLRPGGVVAGEHIHPTQQQTITVLSGELHCQAGKNQYVIRADESVTIPPGMTHSQWNPTNTEVFAIKELRPAGRFHHMFRTVFALARNGRTNAKGVPRPLIGAAFMAEFKDVIRPARLRHRLIFGLLAPLCRLLGYRQIIRNYITEFELNAERGNLPKFRSSEGVRLEAKRARA